MSRLDNKRIPQKPRGNLSYRSRADGGDYGAVTKQQWLRKQEVAGRQTRTHQRDRKRSVELFPTGSVSSITDSSRRRSSASESDAVRVGEWRHYVQRTGCCHRRPSPRRKKLGKVKESDCRCDAACECTALREVLTALPLITAQRSELPGMRVSHCMTYLP